MQDTINQIVEGFSPGIEARKLKLKVFCEKTFDLDEILGRSFRCGTVVPNWFLEFDRDNLDLLEKSFSPERMEELKSGAEPTPAAKSWSDRASLSLSITERRLPSGHLLKICGRSGSVAHSPGSPIRSIANAGEAWSTAIPL